MLVGSVAGVKKWVSPWGCRDERRDFPGAGRAGVGVVERAADGRFLLLRRLLLGATIASTESCNPVLWYEYGVPDFGMGVT